ncbi:MAG: ribosome silencing factor [Deltaproteobacteria bacterium]|nr:ribosome silencing factor [Deltaproteobacteria bacterium]
MIPTSKEKTILCAQAALDHKAIDLAILEVKNLSSFTDYFIICSGNSDRQVQAIASHIEEKLGRQGLHPLGVEGKREGRWILLDYGDVVIHIFYDPIRQVYDLERLWSDAPRLELPPSKGPPPADPIKEENCSSP